MSILDERPRPVDFEQEMAGPCAAQAGSENFCIWLKRSSEASWTSPPPRVAPDKDVRTKWLSEVSGASRVPNEAKSVR
jgi:hypothetical protein